MELKIMEVLMRGSNITSNKGRLISANPIEELFLSVNNEKIKAFTDYQIKRIAREKISTEDFFNSYLPELDKEIKEKFALTAKTEFLIDNIKAPIIVKVLESEK